MGSQPRLIEVRKNVLKQNDLVARSLARTIPRRRSFCREPCIESRLGQDHVLGKDSYPAASKLSRCRARRRSRHRKRCRAAGAQPGSRQTNHSPARCVISKPPWSRTRWRNGTSTNLDFLFIENVGNLVCPSSYDLGRKSPARAYFGDRRRGQAAQVSDDLQQCRRGDRHEDGPGPRLWNSIGNPHTATSRLFAPACRC